MASSGHCSHWEAPTFHLNSPNQSEDWSVLYTRVLDYLDALDIEQEAADGSHKQWKQLKLMFDGEDRKTLQTLIDSGVMTPEHMLTPKATLDVISNTIKLEEHFWAHRDELVLDLQQQPDEGIHTLSQHICDLTKSKFTHAPTIEMLKIKVLQHAVKYHEARDWIRQQDQSQLTYQALLSHCKMLEAQCEQYQKAKERGHADLASITAATSSLHLDALSSPKHWCKKYGYCHPNGKCPAKGQQCYACGGYNFTLCCASRRDAARTTHSEEASSPSATPAMDVVPAATHGGTTAEVIACIVIPGPLPTVLHIVQPMAHHPGTPLIPKGTQLPTGTTRTL